MKKEPSYCPAFMHFKHNNDENQSNLFISKDQLNYYLENAIRLKM